MSQPHHSELEQAYEEAVRTSSRLSVMGALGFGAALVMGVLLLTRGSFSSAFPVETLLLAGGLGGGLAFTVLASRASRVARECRRRLGGHVK